MLLIVVSPHHSSPTPLRMSLGRHMLMIIRESNQAFAFESVSDTEGIQPKPQPFSTMRSIQLCMCSMYSFNRDQVNAGTGDKLFHKRMAAMTLEIKPAQKFKRWARVCFWGCSKQGKTHAALAIATAMVGGRTRGRISSGVRVVQSARWQVPP